MKYSASYLDLKISVIREGQARRRMASHFPNLEIWFLMNGNTVDVLAFTKLHFSLSVVLADSKLMLKSLNSFKNNARYMGIN